jgi:hypothetical protein
MLLRVMLLGSILVVAQRLPAQTAAQRTPEERRALYQAHQGDFDYLLGDWEFTAVSRQYGTFRGYWSAVRLAEGAQVYDEYRIVGDSGETYYLTATMRVYNSGLDQWELVSMEPGTGLQNAGTGHKVGPEMHIEQRFGIGTATPSLWRIRYYDIGPDHFSWTADRSTDDGRTWTTGFQQIEARRIGPPRTLGPLAPARRPAGGRSQ